MPAGRPPEPVEVKMLHQRTPGHDSGGRPLPEPVNPKLARAELVPPIPEDVKLLTFGQRKWTEIWTAAWWLHDEDIHFVVFICKNYDRIYLFQQQIDAEGLTVPGYMGKGTVEHPLIPLQLKIERAIVSDLGQMGFGPVARNKLALGVIKSASALEQLQNKNNGTKRADWESDAQEDPPAPDDTVEAELTDPEPEPDLAPERPAITQGDEDELTWGDEAA